MWRRWVSPGWNGKKGEEDPGLRGGALMWRSEGHLL